MKLLFGGTIALILLGLYVYSVGEAVMIAMSDQGGVLKTGFANTMNTVGGLVSALVIAELAITKPGEAPAVRVVSADSANPAGPGTTRIVAIIGSLYVLVWIVLGLTAYIVGAMLYEGKVPTLTDFGSSWLGLAVAAGYAYFGLSRTS